MTVTYLPYTGDIEDPRVRANFEYIESYGVFHAVPAVAVTGSRGGNAALTSLLTQLAATGIITDNSSP